MCTCVRVCVRVHVFLVPISYTLFGHLYEEQGESLSATWNCILSETRRDFISLTSQNLVSRKELNNLVSELLGSLLSSTRLTCSL